MKLRTSGTEKKISLFIPLHIFAIIFISKVSDWNFSSVSVSLISFFYVSCFHRVLQNPASDTSRHTRGESNRHKLEWDFTLIFISSDCVCFELDWVAREIRLNVEIKFFFSCDTSQDEWNKRDDKFRGAGLKCCFWELSILLEWEWKIEKIVKFLF